MLSNATLFLVPREFFLVIACQIDNHIFSSTKMLHQQKSKIEKAIYFGFLSIFEEFFLKSEIKQNFDVIKSHLSELSVTLIHLSTN